MLGYNQPLLPVNGLKENLYATLRIALHNSFTEWRADDTEAETQKAIQQLLYNMQLNRHIQPQELDKQFNAFWPFIVEQYAPASITKELPLRQVSPNNGSITSGIAEMVLDTEDGLILIDHKTFPGHFNPMALNPEHDHYAGKYGSQLLLYKQMLEDATGKRVVKMLLHYVVQGRGGAAVSGATFFLGRH